MKVLIISGGSSSERNISLISARAVRKVLVNSRHKVKVFDLKEGYEDLKVMIRQFDVIFPVIHGEEGEGGKLHYFLSKTKKPVVGTKNYKALQRGWPKLSFKQFCDENNIPTARWKTVRNRKDIILFGFPCVLKASNGGSSREVQILASLKDLNSYQSGRLINSNKPLYVERYLDGVEITVGIFQDSALPVIEVVSPKGTWLSYKTKYSGMTQDIPNAPSLDIKTRRLAQEIALEIHSKLGLGDYSRIDFIVSNGVPNALEVNTIPGMTPISAYPKAAQAAGISFPELIKKLVEMA